MSITPRRIGVALLTLLGTFALLAVLYAESFPLSSGFDPPAATVGNARLLESAVIAYTRDYDEGLPPMDTQAHFQAAVTPFVPLVTPVPPSQVFLSKVTGQPFIPNAALSEVNLSTIEYPGTAALFRDTVPPSTIPATVAFLDGHVERGGVIQGDPVILSTQNAQQLAFAVLQYEQDSDQRLPPTDTQAHFQAALSSFVRNDRLFTDPLSGKPFVPNPAVSGAVVFTLSDPAGTVLLQSPRPYKDGFSTIAYVDGHVTHGSIQLPPGLGPPPRDGGALDASNLRRIGVALIQYTQDDNEVLPPAKDYSTFEADLLPYSYPPFWGLTPETFIQPDTGLPYAYNSDISGQNLINFPDPAHTVVLQDPALNNDGVLNTLYLDSKVRQQYFFVPRRIALGPNGQTYLLWNQAQAQTALWTLDPTGSTLSQTTYPVYSSASSFSVSGDGKARTGAYIFSPSGSADLALSYGPFAGWVDRLIASDAGGNSRLLYRRYDGVYALWTASPEGLYEGDIRYPLGTSVVAEGLALGVDGDTRLLLKEGGTFSHLLTLDASGQTLQTYTAMAHRGFVISALALGADDAPRLLFTDGNGHGEVWTLTPDGSRRTSVVGFTLAPGFAAVSLAVGKAGDLRVLWIGPNDVARLQTLGADGKAVSVHEFDPYQ